VYIRWAKLAVSTVADCLAAPVALGMAAEQLGALLAGSDFGRESSGSWVVVYSSELASRWSGTPLGVALYPVQAYAAAGAFALAAVCYGWLFFRRRAGDVAGVWLLGTGILLFVTEMFRDWEGRGVLLRGAVDAPQLVGLEMVLLAGLLLLDWPRLNRSNR
jgi:phosphatidylglycerol:prolipoprotein diacylglycerol transferase